MIHLQIKQLTHVSLLFSIKSKNIIFNVLGVNFTIYMLENIDLKLLTFLRFTSKIVLTLRFTII